MDFGKMFETWLKVLTKPGEEVFQQEREKPEAKLSTALIWIIISAVIIATVSFISSFFMKSLLEFFLELVKTFILLELVHVSQHS